MTLDLERLHQLLVVLAIQLVHQVLNEDVPLAHHDLRALLLFRFRLLVLFGLLGTLVRWLLQVLQDLVHLAFV